MTNGAIYIYDRDMILHGVIDEINSLIWTRRYWSAGEFKLLVPFTSKHVSLLVKNNLIMKRGDTEAAEIRYVHISKNSQGLEEIEVQGKFIPLPVSSSVGSIKTFGIARAATFGETTVSRTIRYKISCVPLVAAI